MRPSNLEEVRAAFSAQAEGFDSTRYHLARTDYLAYVRAAIAPEKTDDVLEVAAGTCICGRALAPHVHHVVCLDATEAMLAEGRRECEQAGIHNMTLVRGYAEELPFLDGTFDIVLSRLAFHHMTDCETTFREMARVLKPGGKLVLIDMVPGDESLRDRVDDIERLRDPSHVHDLTAGEMRNLYERNGISLEVQEQTDIPVGLEGWMSLTHTDEKTRDRIRRLMEEDLHGGERSGFDPYEGDGEVWFTHHWVLNVGRT